MADKIDSLIIPNSAGVDMTYDIDLPPDASIHISEINDMSADAMKNGMVHSVVSNITNSAGSATSGSYLSVKWSVSDVDGITEPYDGMKVVVRIPRIGVSTAGVVFSIDGGTTYHPVAYNATTILTSHYAVNTNKMLIYNANLSMTCYITAGVSTTVTGIWQAESDYDSNSTIVYGTLAYYYRPYVSQAVYRYKLGMIDKDNRFVPFNTSNIIGVYAASTSYSKNQIVTYSGLHYISLVSSNKGHTPDSSPTYWSVYTGITPPSIPVKPDKIYWYNTTTTISQNGAIGGNTLMSVGYNATNMSICNFPQYNSSSTVTLPAYRMIYIRGNYNKTTGLFSFKDGGVAGSKNFYALVPCNSADITLSDYFVNGDDYILLGATYSSDDYIHLREDHPMFHFDGLNLVPYDKTLIQRDIVVSQKTANTEGAYMTASAFSSNPPSGVAGQVLFVIQGE